MGEVLLRRREIKEGMWVYLGRGGSDRDEVKSIVGVFKEE